MTNLTRVQIVDKNGKLTHVHKNLIQDAEERRAILPRYKRSTAAGDSGDYYLDEVKKSPHFAFFSWFVDSLEETEGTLNDKFITLSSKSAEFLQDLSDRFSDQEVKGFDSNTTALQTFDDYPDGEVVPPTFLRSTDIYLQDAKGLMAWNPAIFQNGIKLQKVESRRSGNVVTTLTWDRGAVSRFALDKYKEGDRSPFVYKLLFTANPRLKALFGPGAMFDKEEFDKYMAKNPDIRWDFNRSDKPNVFEAQAERIYDSQGDQPEEVIDWAHYLTEYTRNEEKDRYSDYSDQPVFFHGDQPGESNIRGVSLSSELPLEMKYRDFAKYIDRSQRYVNLDAVYHAIDEEVDPEEFKASQRQQ